MRLSVLSSGSCGNCFYVEEKDDAVLVDAGISCKQICERLKIIGRSPEKVRGIFITHEHCDHVKGVDVFSREFQIPIFATEKTIENFSFYSELVNPIKNDETTKIGGMNVEAFSKSHRASDPVSYNILNSKKVSIITDLGYACNNAVDSISGSNFLCIESNHDLKMLEEGHYPWHLKKWIASDSGHLSNLQAGIAVLENGSSKLKNIILSHLSQTNNTPKLALKTFNRIIKERMNFSPKVIANKRGEMSSLISV